MQDGFVPRAEVFDIGLCGFLGFFFVLFILLFMGKFFVPIET